MSDIDDMERAMFERLPVRSFDDLSITAVGIDPSLTLGRAYHEHVLPFLRKLGQIGLPPEDMSFEEFSNSVSPEQSSIDTL